MNRTFTAVKAARLLSYFQSIDTWSDPTSITPDRETGIGNWNDREIARAIRSGVTPDGRVLHW